MKNFFVEKFNASDDSYRINDIYFSSGSYVEGGKIIFSIESSKADIDIEVQENGYLYFNFIKGESINVGDLFYIVSQNELSDLTGIFKQTEKKSYEGISVSQKAYELMKKHGVNPLEIKKKIIKEDDVLKYLKSKNSKLLFKSDLILDCNSKTPLVIIGAGGGAKMCIDLLRNSNEYLVVGLLDDNVELGKKVLDIPVIGNIQCAKQLLEFKIYDFIIAFGVLENRIKRFELYKSLKELGCRFPNIIHPNSIIENSVELGEGNVILAGANIGSSAKLGNLNYVNNNALISHDCILMDNIHIAPGAVLASSIKIESHVLIGMNSTIYYGLTIGESSTILNGLIINNNIKNNVTQKLSN
jgi:sugar O-acyltransferase (sialic acid O-acetyltransferase NeuD family)